MSTLYERTQRRLFAPIYMLSYLLIAVAGVLYMLQPAPSVQDVMGPTLHTVWAGFIATGGLVCAGSYRYRTLTQFVGLPLLISACGLLGAAFLLESYGGIPRPSGLLFLGMGGLLHTYWRIIAHRRRPDGGLGPPGWD